MSFASTVRSYFSGPASASSPTSSKSHVTGYQSSSRSGSSLSWAQKKSSLVQETTSTLTRKSHLELGASVSQSLHDVSFIKLVEFVRNERLSSIPHKGSRWDTVLIRSLHVAEYLHKFDSAIQGFVLDSTSAANLGFAHLQLLLQLGHRNSAALDKAFGFFYKSSLTVSSLIDRSSILATAPAIQEELGILFSDLVTLIVDVAIRFYKTVHASNAVAAHLDMYEAFGETIESFRARRVKIANAIWTSQIEGRVNDLEAPVAIDVLENWIGPQDRVLQLLSSDHTTFTDQQSEQTALWFHDDLVQFVKSSNECLLLNAPEGHGKTTIAASIVERLQRPVARRSFSTVFVSIGAVPSQAVSLEVVKSVLSQLVNIRIGDVTLYKALATAYEKARETADAAQYETHLWNALASALQSTSDASSDTIIVIDGLDEIEGGKTAGQALLDRLTRTIGMGKRAKLVGLSTSLAFPSTARGTKRDITPDNTRDDIHTVAIRYLSTTSHFTTKPSQEQERLLASLTEAANGSFFWTILACDNLKAEKSAEAFNKTLQWLTSTPPTAHDLVLKLFNAIQPSNEAKLLISWLAVAARPLTFDEIRGLLSVDIEKTTLVADGRHDVDSIVNSVHPFLSVSGDVARLKHGSLTRTLKDLFTSGKITLPVKDRQCDFLLRLLTYAKLSLPQDSVPVLDPTTPSLPANLFQRNGFLEYTIRYWHWTFSQTHYAGIVTSSSPKVPPELVKAMPDSVAMPILEWSLWDDQFAGIKQVHIHESTGRLRSLIFHETPTIMQSHINCASYYQSMGNDRETTKYYYLATVIGHTALSPTNPVTIECATRYIAFSSSMTTTTRTEIMTQRERILTILITAYERQFGESSEIVLRTREQLIELYMAIGEEDRARELIGKARDDVIARGGDSSHGKDYSDHLRIQLSKGKGQTDLETFQKGIFMDNDEAEEETRVLDLTGAAALLKLAESYFAQKKYTEAEETYVELWQQLSEHCRSTTAVAWHEQKIVAVNAYSKFLKSQKRETEAASVLTTIAEEYRHHQLSYSEAIISRLTETAHVLKSVGRYSAALSIFRQAASYFESSQSTRDVKSSSLTTIEEEIAITSTEALKQATIETSSESTSVSASQSSYRSIFQSMITNKTKTIDQTTMTLSKKLVQQYTEERRYEEVVQIVTLTLSRTWSSFLSETVHTSTLTSTFLEDSVYLVERLAETYLLQRKTEKAMEIHARLFRAVLTSAEKHKELLEKTKKQTITIYDKYGYFDKSIGILQAVLPVYTRVYGESHELTITTLYDLGARCHRLARSHPYYLEYYQRIVTILTKEKKLTDIKAFEAAILVANTYWEEHRYTEAQAVFAIIWTTFVTQTKQFKQFSETSFVERLYERYYQCLEATSSDFETLHQVTKQYRETCVSTFGASSAITVAATVCLARLTETNEKYIEESIFLYEEASKHVSSSSSSSHSHFSSSETKSQLSKLYRRRITQQSSSASSELISRAIAMSSEQLQQSVSSYGYAHESSLSSLREVASLSFRQQKTEIATREISKAVTEISTKKSISEEQVMQGAVSIAQIFQSSKQMELATHLVHELHSQIIAKEKRTSERGFSFDLTSSSHTSLSFLAALEYNLHLSDQTLSEIYSDLLAESFFYTKFRSVMKASTGLDKIVIAAAPLRYFLLRRKRTIQAESLETQITNLFVQRDTADLKMEAKSTSPRIFIVGLLDYLGGKKHQNFVRAVILATNISLRRLVDNNKFAEAYDIANMGYIYAHHHRGYHGPRAISSGFELASYLDGRGENRCPDETLRKKLLTLSNRIVKEILTICEEQKINLAQVRLTELNELIALLGEQGDYVTLEKLLTSLWNTREAQKGWDPEVRANLGQRLICARYLAGHPIMAIRLAEDVSYNFRRANGVYHPATLEAYRLLAELYTSTGLSYQKTAGADKHAASAAADYFRRAVLVHEEILTWLSRDSATANGTAHNHADDDDDDEDTAATILKNHGIRPQPATTNGAVTASHRIDRAAEVKTHLRLLKLAYQRLGSWPKPYGVYEHLNADLFRVYGTVLKGVEGVEKWSVKGYGGGKAESAEGQFDARRKWDIVPVSLAVAHA